MNPSDYTCTNSTLHFICEHANRYSVTHIVTFDQPLWWSVHETSVLRDIVLRLGGFNTEISFFALVIKWQVLIFVNHFN